MNTLSSSLIKCSSEPIHIIDKSINLGYYIPIDLSHSNPELKRFDISSSKAWQEYIQKYLKKHNAKVAYGGYLEQRNIYDRSNYFNVQDKKLQRNIHLGIDLWCDAEKPVLAALDGEIHSFKNNTNFGDYGPTLILKHVINNYTFYTLYGHLSLDSIYGIKVGDFVSQGDTIAYLGDAKINGDYAPHLHFQIIVDIQDNYGDYPGVSNLIDLEFYRKNCLDPNLILKL